MSHEKVINMRSVRLASFGYGWLCLLLSVKLIPDLCRLMLAVMSVRFLRTCWITTVRVHVARWIRKVGADQNFQVGIRETTQYLLLLIQRLQWTFFLCFRQGMHRLFTVSWHPFRSFLAFAVSLNTQTASYGISHH